MKKILIEIYLLNILLLYKTITKYPKYPQFLIIKLDMF